MNSSEYKKLCESTIPDVEALYRKRGLDLTNQIIIKRKLMKDNIYVEWLNDYMKSRNYFASNLEYDPQLNFNRNDQFSRALGLFYNIINNYAKSKNIYAVTSDLTKYYFLQVENKNYMIGKNNFPNNQEYFCAVASKINSEDSCISYNDLKESNITINLRLEILSEIINNLVNADVSTEDIEYTIDNVLKDIKTNEKSKKMLK